MLESGVQHGDHSSIFGAASFLRAIEVMAPTPRAARSAVSSDAEFSRGRMFDGSLGRISPWSGRITDTPMARKRVLLLVSREDHCLADLLYRWRSGDMECDITSVVSNHEDLRSFVEWHQIPFHAIPVPAEAGAKAAAFENIGRIFGRDRADVMVLARYMQILPASLCTTLSGRIIKIHHSFLPSFAGSRPYHQAFAGAWRQADRRHVSLRHGRPRRGAHHRAGHPSDRSCGQPRGIAPGRPATSSARCWPAVPQRPSWRSSTAIFRDRNGPRCKRSYARRPQTRSRATRPGRFVERVRRNRTGGDVSGIALFAPVVVETVLVRQGGPRLGGQDSLERCRGPRPGRPRGRLGAAERAAVEPGRSTMPSTEGALSARPSSPWWPRRGEPRSPACDRRTLVERLGRKRGPPPRGSATPPHARRPRAARRRETERARRARVHATASSCGRTKVECRRSAKLSSSADEIGLGPGGTTARDPRPKTRQVAGAGAEPLEAYRLDAFLELLNGSDRRGPRWLAWTWVAPWTRAARPRRPKAPETQAIAVIDAAALASGHDRRRRSGRG